MSTLATANANRFASGLPALKSLPDQAEPRVRSMSVLSGMLIFNLVSGAEYMIPLPEDFCYPEPVA